jgi:predicted transcriptional regulator
MIRTAILKELDQQGWSVLELSQKCEVRYQSINDYLKHNKEISSKNLEKIFKTLKFKIMKTNIEVIEKTEKYAILKNCITTDDAVIQMGGTAFLTGSFSSTPELEKIHETRCEVLADWGLDTSEDVIVIFENDWAEKIKAEINSKLKF